MVCRLRTQAFYQCWSILFRIVLHKIFLIDGQKFLSCSDSNCSKAMIYIAPTGQRAKIEYTAVDYAGNIGTCSYFVVVKGKREGTLNPQYYSNSKVCHKIYHINVCDYVHLCNETVHNGNDLKFPKMHTNFPASITHGGHSQK